MSNKSLRKAARMFMQHPFKQANVRRGDAMAYLERAASNRDNRWLHRECIFFADRERQSAARLGFRLP